jgi:hypothetical protein
MGTDSDPFEPNPFLPQITQMAQIPNQEDRFYLRSSALLYLKMVLSAFIFPSAISKRFETRSFYKR